MGKPKLRVAVTGGRAYWDYYNVCRALNRVGRDFTLVVIHGGAKGADDQARVYCERTRTEMIVERAEWDKFGDAAGGIRNQAMIDKHKPQLLLAFPGGSGTNDMVQRCSMAGIPIKVIPERENAHSQVEQVTAA